MPFLPKEYWFYSRLGRRKPQCGILRNTQVVSALGSRSRLSLGSSLGRTGECKKQFAEKCIQYNVTKLKSMRNFIYCLRTKNKHGKVIRTTEGSEARPNDDFRGISALCLPSWARSSLKIPQNIFMTMLLYMQICC